MTRKLTQDQVNTLTLALRTAGEVYLKDASHFSEQPPTPADVPNPRLHAQFTQQAKDANDLIALIESADVVKVQRYTTARELDVRYEDPEGC